MAKFFEKFLVAGGNSNFMLRYWWYDTVARLEVNAASSGTVAITVHVVS